MIGSLDLQQALGAGQGRVRARAAGRGPPRHPVRRRGQPAARPPGRPAAGRRRDGPLDGRARRRLGRPRRPVRAGRHHEPRGGRAPAAAARPVRADRRDRRPARPARCGPRWSAAGWRTTPTRTPSSRGSPTQERALRRPDRGRAGAARTRCELSDGALIKIAEVCAGFEVDGMRADIVTARAAVAHAAWHGRTDGDPRADIRAAARLALPAPPAPQPVRRPRPGRGPARPGRSATTTSTRAASPSRTAGARRPRTPTPDDDGDVDRPTDAVPTSSETAEPPDARTHRPADGPDQPDRAARSTGTGRASRRRRRRRTGRGCSPSAAPARARPAGGVGRSPASGGRSAPPRPPAAGCAAPGRDRPGGRAAAAAPRPDDRRPVAVRPEDLRVGGDRGPRVQPGPVLRRRLRLDGRPAADGAR